MSFNLDLNKSATSRLGLEPIKNADNAGYKYDGLIPAFISSVTLVDYKYEKGEFAGQPVKVLRFEYMNVKAHASLPDRFYSYDIKPIHVGKKDGTFITDEVYGNLVQEQFSHIKHIMDTFQGLPNYRNIGNISIEDKEKYFVFDKDASVEERVAAHNNYCEFIANFINGDGNITKPLFKDATNKEVHFFLKLVVVDGFYSIPTYTGQGFMERIRYNGSAILPALSIKVKPNETLEIPVKGSKANPAIRTGSEASPSDELDEETKKALGLA